MLNRSKKGVPRIASFSRKGKTKTKNPLSWYEKISRPHRKKDYEKRKGTAAKGPEKKAGHAVARGDSVVEKKPKGTDM